MSCAFNKGETGQDHGSAPGSIPRIEKGLVPGWRGGSSWYGEGGNRRAGKRYYTWGPKAGVLAIGQAIDVVMEGRSVLEAAKEYKELEAAIDLWGVNDKLDR